MFYPLPWSEITFYRRVNACLVISLLVFSACVQNPSPQSQARNEPQYQESNVPVQSNPEQEGPSVDDEASAEDSGDETDSDEATSDSPEEQQETNHNIPSYKRVIYWGQNGYGSTDPNPSNWEPSLTDTCSSARYDVVVIGFVPTYFDPRNPGALPSLNLSYHCDSPFEGYVSLLNCPQIEEEISACQQAGVKVLISLGGAVGTYLFDDDEQASRFAQTIWDMYLGGFSPNVPRPFAGAVLDGVDLDIEAGGLNHHAAFARALRGHMDGSPKDYTLAAAPQCPMPDAHLGPTANSALGEYPTAFDELYVQFYNNYCRYDADNPAAFEETFAAWAEWAIEVGGPLIFVGLPAMPSAAPAGGYVAIETLPSLLGYARTFEAFGGIMLWDASFDARSESVHTGTYMERASTLLNSEATVPADDDHNGSDTTTTTPQAEGCAAGTQVLSEILTLTLRVTSNWSTGQNVEALLSNVGSTTIDNLRLRVNEPVLIQSIWGLQEQGDVYHLPSWQPSIAPGEAFTFGLTASARGLPCFALESETEANTDLTQDSSGSHNDGEDSPETETSPTFDQTKRVVAYFVEWGIYDRNYHVADIPADKLTHVNYAFANISESGECVIYDSYAAIDRFYPGDSWEPGSTRGNFNQLRQMKETHPHLKTLISVGGWTLSSRFSEIAGTTQSRQKFVSSCVDFMKHWGFDGIDIDWEYPVTGGMTDGSPEDKENFTALLAAFHQTLNTEAEQDATNYLLTIAAPAGPNTYTNIELADIHRYLDFINVMTYDFHGAWENKTNHHAPLYASQEVQEGSDTGLNVDAAISAYLAAGVPRDKIVLGTPFYGRGWQGVSQSTHGLHQPASGAAAGGTWEPGVFDYADIASNYLGAYERHWDSLAMAPWLYSPQTGVFISYEDPESLAIKANYVNTQALGGVMFWELSSDTESSTLLNTIYQTFSE